MSNVTTSIYLDEELNMYLSKITMNGKTYYAGDYEDTIHSDNPVQKLIEKALDDQNL